MGSAGGTLSKEQDLQSTYVNCCSNLPDDKTVIVVGSQRVEEASDLFYAPVSIGGQSTLRGMLDSGSMSCTLSVEAESKLRTAGVLPSPQPVPEKVVLVGCGGLTTQPRCIYDLSIEIYGSKFIVPTFLVPGQGDELIIGSNDIRPMIQRMKSDEKYWELICSDTSDPSVSSFFSCSVASPVGLVLNCLTRLEPLDYVRLSPLHHSRSIWCGGSCRVVLLCHLVALSSWSPPLPVPPLETSSSDGWWHPCGEIAGSR